MKPAEVTVRSDIKKIAVIDRSKPSSAVMHVVEGLFTGETINQDLEASQKAIDGFANILTNSPRLEVVTTGARLKGSKTGNSFIEPLPWKDIQHYCNEYGSDAVVALEVFDTDYDVSTNEFDVETYRDGNWFTKKMYRAEAEASGMAGFRFYDPKRREIIDQNICYEQESWREEGETENEARSRLFNKVNREGSINRVSYRLGEIYGKKIVPIRVMVSRSLYKKSKKNEDIENGFRKAGVRDWNGAIEAWSRALKSSDKKVCGKAAYNIAVANEVLGDLKSAKKWAQTAYTKYGNTKGKKYTAIIDKRIADEELVKKQMGTILY
jgi:hypothetical protein